MFPHQEISRARPGLPAWGALLGLLLLCACQENRKEFERINLLRDATRQFALALRWGDAQEAARFVRLRPGKDGAAARGGAAAPKTNALSEVEVSRYEVLDIVVDPETGKSALVSTRFQYYSKNSAAVRDLVDRQSWWYDDALRRWFRDAHLPGLK